LTNTSNHIGDTATFANQAPTPDASHKLLADLQKGNGAGASHGEAPESPVPAQLFLEGLVSGAVLDPINGVGQIVSHSSSNQLNEIHFANQELVDKSPAGKIGRFVGNTIDYVALAMLAHRAVEGVGIKKGASMLSMGLAGGISGGIFTPTPSDSKHFFRDRAVMAGSGAITGAGAGAFGGFIGRNTAQVSSSIESRGMVAMTTTSAGAVAGIFSTELNTYAFTGRPANRSELLAGIGIGAATGAVGGLGALRRASLAQAFERVGTPSPSTELDRLAQETARPDLLREIREAASTGKLPEKGPGGAKGAEQGAEIGHPGNDPRPLLSPPPSKG
jgi:hypothetical protein